MESPKRSLNRCGIADLGAEHFQSLTNNADVSSTGRRVSQQDRSFGMIWHFVQDKNSLCTCLFESPRRQQDCSHFCMQIHVIRRELTCLCEKCKGPVGPTLLVVNCAQPAKS